MEGPGEATEQSDAELVAGCRQGDAGAWEALVRRYQRLIYSIPMRAGLGEDASADVFQHVFTTLFEKLDTLEQPERVASWLVTTARREAWRTGRRTRADGASLSGDSQAVDLVDQAPLPDELLERMEAQHAVRVAVHALDERCRVLLTLLFYNPEPPAYEQLAARLGVAEGSIGPTRARCLQKLRKLMEAG